MKSHSAYVVKPSDCGCTPSSSSNGMCDGISGIAPRGGLFGADAQLAGGLGVPGARVRRDPQVVCRHHVGEHVVPHDRGVFVGTGDPVEVPYTVAVVVSE